MSTIGFGGLVGGALDTPRGADICQEIARTGERALRLQLGALHLELRLQREPTVPRVGTAPEWSDVELERLARSSRQTYRASWEPGMAMTYGGVTRIPR